MNIPSKEELEKLQIKQQYAQMDKLKQKQAAAAKELQHLQRSTTPDNKGRLIRLQCRSYPLSAAIIIDGNLTNFVTPHTFDDLPEGKHTVEMHHFSEDGTLVIKKEEVELKKGLRSICKLHFKTPRTLAEPIV